MTAIEKAKEAISEQESQIQHAEWNILKAKESIEYTKSEIQEKQEEIDSYDPDMDDEEVYNLFRDEMCETQEEVTVFGVTFSPEQLFEMTLERDHCAMSEEFSYWSDNKLRDSSYTFPAQEEMKEELEDLEDTLSTMEQDLECDEDEVESMKEDLETLEEDLEELEQAELDAEDE